MFFFELLPDHRPQHVVWEEMGPFILQHPRAPYVIWKEEGRNLASLSPIRKASSFHPPPSLSCHGT
jgi:hypothetical protein